MDSLNNVYVYYNGNDFVESHGWNYGENQYLFGQKWQCVEFVIRYYYKVLEHKMPNVYGNATDYFNPAIPHGQVNPDRGLIQYQNGNNKAPKVSDLLIFQNSSYGHVAIVSEVRENSVEYVQQNMIYPRDSLALFKKDGNYQIGQEDGYAPVGWLRKE